MSNEPFDQPPAGFEPPVDYPAPPSPPPPPPPVARQLVRDPYTRLGGVASGLAHHYGIDVSLVRIGFVVFTIISGFGLPIYLLSWLIIPRAQYWPPIGARKPVRAMSGREIGIGLLLLVALITLFFNGGGLSHVLVPLMLVIGGVWLLIQPADDEATVGAPSGPSQPVDSISPTLGGVPPGSPVPPRRRRWRPLVFGIVLLLVAIPTAVVSAFLFADIEINSDFSATYQPVDVEAIQTRISHDQGEVVVDLTELRPSMFKDGSVPMEVDLGFGAVRIIVPDDLVVEVDATAGVGDIMIFDQSADGIKPKLRVPGPTGQDAHMVMDLKVGFGEINVQRG